MGDLSALEALSGIFGSVSLASWILVLVPQLLENYKAKNAQGISLAFLAVWLISVTNLIGAVWAGLVPTVIALAFYFCLADAVLILQCLYYHYLFPHAVSHSPSTEDELLEDPRQPLLAQQSSNLGLPGSRRRSTASEGQRRDEIISSDKHPWITSWITNTAVICGVFIIGTLGWAIVWKIGLWAPVHDNDQDANTRGRPVGAEILGYISACCYLGARIPQIVKNHREKSCEGLSLLFFMLSLLGNATYGGGILFHSVQRDYILTNLPWLIGSLGTMGEDVIIFVQFHKYGDPRNRA